MNDQQMDLFETGQHRNWLRLRTIIIVRWVVITGQIVALVMAQRVFHLQLELGLCFLAVGIAVIGNLVAIFVFPESKRLSESQNFFIFLFDLVQLAFLLFLSGGLHNPFSVLVLGPISISASVLTARSTVILGAIAIALITILVEFHLPLRTEQGFILRIPEIFVFGNWVAITIAILFMSVYSLRVMTEMQSMTRALAATQMALAREQKLTDLGGVVAAAAHELGTPLATIKLVSSELIDELSDRDDLREDAELIRSQADRCRDILQSMGRAGKNDLQLRLAPLAAVVEEAAEPHKNRGKSIEFLETEDLDTGITMPTVLRRPEIVHGLRNLIQNAVDFAHASVWIEIRCRDDIVSIRIMDDGPGYPTNLIGRLGDPFTRSRRVVQESNRPEYEGMGLGLFIAKTLLERTGAELSFANGPDTRAAQPRSGRVGAIVEVVWPRGSLEVETVGGSTPLGDNPLIEV